MEKHSLGRILSIFTAPTKTFRSIAERPTWVVALIFTAVVSLAVMAVAVPKIDWEGEIRSKLAESSVELSTEQIEQQIELTEKFGGIMTYVSAAVGPLIFYPFIALLFWGALRMAGGQAGFKTVLSTVTYSFLPGLLKLVLGLPVLLGRSSITTEMLQNGTFLMSNLSFLASETSSTVTKALLSSVDAFSIWTIVLLVIGFQVTAKVSRGASIACVGGLWTLGIAIKVGLALVGQMFS